MRKNWCRLLSAAVLTAALVILPAPAAGATPAERPDTGFASEAGPSDTEIEGTAERPDTGLASEAGPSDTEIGGTAERPDTGFASEAGPSDTEIGGTAERPDTEFAAEAVRASLGTDREKPSTSPFGPGYRSLPVSDPYGDYQWALLNTGVFKLVPSRQSQAVEFIQDWMSEGMPRNYRPGPSGVTEETTLSVPGIDINILPAWEKYEAKQEKRQVVVAVIDTGVDYSHIDLRDAIWINREEIPNDGIDNDGNGFVDDVFGWNFFSDSNQVFTGDEDDHGTHAAGTIAAAKNGVGIAGINDPAYVRLMILKTLGTQGGIGSSGNVAKAIRYAEANGASICNLSFGTKRYSEELYETMKNSRMLFVVAAGNGDSAVQGYDIDKNPLYPAAFDLDNIISVANLKFDGKLESASNFGAVGVDLAAPGDYILSTVSGNRYDYMSGTSMAAPMVTGAAALLYSYDGEIAVTQIKGLLLNSVKRLDSLSGKVSTGGMLDVAAALNLAAAG